MDKFLISKRKKNSKTSSPSDTNNTTQEHQQQGTSLSSTTMEDSSSPLPRKKARTETSEILVMDVNQLISMIESKKKQISVLQSEIDELESLLQSARATCDKSICKEQEETLPTNNTVPVCTKAARATTSRETPNHSENKTSSVEDKIIMHYKFELLHLHKDDISLTKKSKKRKGKTQELMLNPERFKQFRWAIYHKPTASASPHGQVFCGICKKAKETGSNQFVSGDPADVKKWVNGFDDWNNYGTVKVWQEHASSMSHKQSIEHLHNRLFSDIRQNVLGRGQAFRTKCQEENRHFFGCVVRSVLHLAKMGDAFFGHHSHDGKLRKTLELLSSQAPYMKRYLDKSQKNNYRQTALHHDDVNFILRNITKQVLVHKFKQLEKCQYACLIADEWSCQYSSTEYVSVSVQYCNESLRTDTAFLGFFPIKSTGAEDVATAIIGAITQIEPNLAMHKVIGQTYDGAANMQGDKTGVQRRIRDESCFFAVNMHCINHQLQLDVKKNTKGNRLLEDVMSYCSILVKLFKYSAKRSMMLVDIKLEIRDNDNYGKSEFTTTVGKVLGLCVTRWTCRADALKRLYTGYFSQIKGFAHILVTKDLRQKLNREHSAEINGMLATMQGFDFLFGLKLAITVFVSIDKYATILQAKSLSVSRATYCVKKLIEELDLKMQTGFDELWDSVESARDALNGLILEDNECQQCGLVDSIEPPMAPRQVARALVDVTENPYEAAKAYWKECYHDAFHNLLNDLRARLESPLLLTLKEMEVIIVKVITSPNLDFNIDQVSKDYGNGSGKPNAPFGDELTKEAIIEEMCVVREEWNKLREEIVPETIDDVIEMVRESMEKNKDGKPLQDWKLEAPIVMKLLSIAAAIAGTSAFAERTFSLARRLKSYLRSQMKDSRFHQLGILAWYPDDELHKIIDLVSVGNSYIEESPEARKLMYGMEFLENDFKPMHFNN